MYFCVEAMGPIPENGTYPGPGAATLLIELDGTADANGK